MAENQPGQDPVQQPKSTQAGGQGQETPASANPDHANPKTARPQSKSKDGAVAATEEEKGGSSE